MTTRSTSPKRLRGWRPRAGRSPNLFSPTSPRGRSLSSLAIRSAPIRWTTSSASSPTSENSPEGCAAILSKSAAKAADAAEAMGITSARLKKLGLVDQVIKEPLGGAHRDVETMAQRLKEVLIESLEDLSHGTPDALVKKRYERLMQFGQFTTRPQ